MKRIAHIVKKICLCIIMLLINGLPSCENDYQTLTIDCSQCYRIKPTEGELWIKLTINSDYRSIPIVIYEGKVEDSLIEYIDTSTTSDYYIDVPVNNYYSVTAKYEGSDRTIIAIDGDKIKTRKIREECDTVCWVIRGGIIDVRLKY